MPWRMRKLKSGRYRVTGRGGRVRAKSTSKRNAKRQIRLLRAVKHGWRPTRRRRGRRRAKRTRRARRK